MTNHNRDARGRKLGYVCYPLEDTTSAAIFDGAGNLAVICTEGVFNAADNFGNVYVYTNDGGTVMRSVNELTPDHEKIADLASFVRVFGARLDANHAGAVRWMSEDNTDEINAAGWTVVETVNGRETRPYTRMTLGEARELKASMLEGYSRIERWENVEREYAVCEYCGDPIDYCQGGHTETITESEAEERFDDMLDDIEPEYHIAGVTLRPSRILKACDPIAYREAFNNYVDSADFNVDGY